MVKFDKWFLYTIDDEILVTNQRIGDKYFHTVSVTIL